MAEPAGTSEGARGVVRTYRGRKLEDILPQIRQELGPDAIILREREGLVGGIGGFFAQRFVEVEARAGGPSIDVYDDDESAEPDQAARPDQAAAPTHSRAREEPELEDAAAPGVNPVEEERDAFVARLREAAAAWSEDDAAVAELPAPAAEEAVADAVIEEPAEPGPDRAAPAAGSRGPATEAAAKPKAPAGRRKPAAKSGSKAAPKSRARASSKPKQAAKRAAKPAAAPARAHAREAPAPVTEAPARGSEAPRPAAGPRETVAVRPPAGVPGRASQPSSAPGPARGLRGVLDRMLRRRAPVAIPEPQPAPAKPIDAAAAASIVAALTTRGGSQLWASQLVAAGGAHGSPLATAGGLRSAARVELARRIVPAPALPAGGAAIGFIGAGGSGKSRCTAALATAYRRASTLTVSVVALGTPDGGTELESLLAAEGVPVHAEGGDAAVRRVSERRAGGLVIVDTPPTTPTDPAAISALAAALAPLSLDALYVTLPATLGAQAARRALASFGALHPTAVAVTHADETDQLGVVVEIATAHRIPLAYIHAGTDIRRSLTIAEPSSLARELLP